MSVSVSGVMGFTNNVYISYPVLTLTEACRQKRLDLVMEAIRRGAKPDDETLTVACQTGDLSIVEKAIEVGAQPGHLYVHDGSGDYVLYVVGTLTAACNTGNLAIVELVINKGAQPDKEERVMNGPCENYYAGTPEAAQRTGNPEIIAQLLKVLYKGIKELEDPTSIEKLTKSCLTEEQCNQLFYSVFEVCTEAGYLAIADFGRDAFNNRLWFGRKISLDLKQQAIVRLASKMNLSWNR